MSAQSEPIPILRSFESSGVKYLAGYAAIFDSEDSYGTAMTREAVESSRERLQSFPAVRFMHRVPFGQIDFENEVKGYKTFIDDHGFHVLCRVYDQCENEWNMVRSGKWGFSYGFMPDAHGGIQTRKLANGHTCSAFVKGMFYEVSVVDTPAHADAAAYVVSRMIQSDTGKNVTTEEPPRRDGVIAMMEAALGTEPTEPLEHTEPETRETSGFLAQLYASTKGKKMTVERQNQAVSIIQRSIDFEASLPDVCDESCIIKRHCSSWPSQLGNVCIKKMEQYKNDKFISRR